MKRQNLLIFQALKTLIISSYTCEVAHHSRLSYHSQIDRDISFGALLPLHTKDKLGRCETPPYKDGVLWLRALNYAVKDVNRRWTREFNASFRLTIRDTCNDEQIALEQALDFAKGYQDRGVDSGLVRQENSSEDLIKPVLGVISASQNQDASILLRLFKVPQVIFGSGKTTAVENSKDILRSVSVDFYRARALADLAKYFSWEAVSVVYSPTHQDDFETFLRISRIEKLCIALTLQLTVEHEHIVEKLLSEPQSTVVFLFTRDEETNALLQSVKDKVSEPHHFTWILTRQQNINCFSGISESDALFLQPQFPFIEGFRDNLENKDDYITFKEVFETPIAPSSCLNSAMFDSTPKRTKEEIQSSMNSVYLLAHAYETAFRTHQGHFDRVVFSRSLGYVHGVLYGQNWKMFSGPHRMKENMFSLIQIRPSGSSKRVVNIGTWDSSWYINNLGINWSSQSTPRSSCGVQCSPGFIRVLKDDSKCCWSCLHCHYNQIVSDEYACADCLRGYWPNEDFTKCEFQWKRTLFGCTLAIVAVVLVFSFMVL